MSILVDFQIQDAIRCQEIVVEPFDESLINPDSIDFLLGKTYCKTKPSGKLVLTLVTELGMDSRVVDINKPPKMRKGESIPANPTAVIDMTDKESFQNEYFEQENYVLQPGEFIVASMLESITLSGDIMAIMKGKGSVARLGLQNSSHGGVVDGGWSGILSMQLCNNNSHPIILRYGQKIGQLIFFRTTQPYKNYKTTGRYSGVLAGEGSQGV